MACRPLPNVKQVIILILLFPQYNNVLTPSSSLLPPCPTIMTGLAQLSLRVTSCPRGIFSNYINPNSNMTKFVPQIKRSQWQIILTWCFLPSTIIILSLLGSQEDLDRSKSRTHPESTRGPRDCFPPNNRSWEALKPHLEEGQDGLSWSNICKLAVL